jgi:hypothetical protein
MQLSITQTDENKNKRLEYVVSKKLSLFLNAIEISNADDQVSIMFDFMKCQIPFNF